MISPVRPALPAFLVLACCSKPLPASAVPDEAKPIAAAPVPAGKLRFVVSTSHEMSCSQSFESDSLYVIYDLAIESTGKTTLTIEGSSTSVFGPSDAKFTGGKVERQSKKIAESWSGTARSTDGSMELDLVSGARSWKLVCASRRVDAKLPSAQGVDAKATKSVEALSCTPTRHVAERDHSQIGALVFSSLPGLESSVRDYGGYADEKAELRLLRE